MRFNTPSQNINKDNNCDKFGIKAQKVERKMKTVYDMKIGEKIQSNILTSR